MSDDPMVKAKEIWDELDQEDNGATVPPGEPDEVVIGGEAEIAPPREGGEGDDGAVGPTLQELMDKIAGLEAQVARTTQSVQNVAGHVGGLNAHIKRIQEEVRTKGHDTPSAAAVAAARTDPEAMNRLREDYPEFAEAMGAALDARLSEIEAKIPQGNTSVPENVVTKEELQTWKNEMYVESRHEGWKDRVKTPEFAGWLHRQPREVQMLAVSDDPRDAVRLLDLHQEATKKPAPNSDHISSAAALPRGRGGSRVTTKSVDQMTPEEYWAYLDEQDRQKR